MSSLFEGKKALRLQYEEVSKAQLNATTTKDDAVCLGILRHQCRIARLLNGTSADIGIVLVHPDADAADSAYRLFAFEIPANTTMNFDAMVGGLPLDAKSKIYVFKTGGAAGDGEKVRAIFWG